MIDPWRLDDAGFRNAAQPCAELQFASRRMTPRHHVAVRDDGDLQCTHAAATGRRRHAEQIRHRRAARRFVRAHRDRHQQIDVAARFQAAIERRSEQVDRLQHRTEPPFDRGARSGDLAGDVVRDGLGHDGKPAMRSLRNATKQRVARMKVAARRCGCRCECAACDPLPVVRRATARRHAGGLLPRDLRSAIKIPARCRVRGSRDIATAADLHSAVVARHYAAASFSFFSARAFTRTLAGFAGNQRSSPVNGSLPKRFFFAGTTCAVIFSRPGSVNSPAPFL